MAYTFSLAHLTANLCSPQELVDVAAQAGYDHVSFRMTPVTATEKVHPLINNRGLMKETLQRLADTSLDVLDVELIRMDPETGPDVYLTFLDAAAELGAKAVICQLPDPDRERTAEKFARLCDLARPYKLAVALEFVSWTDTSDLGAAQQIIRTADRPNGGLLVDTLHFDRSGSSLEELEQTPDSWFHFVHLCDAPSPVSVSKNTTIFTARHNRMFPGKGGLNIREILNRIPIVPYSLEIPNRKLLREMGLQKYCSRALEVTKKYLLSRPIEPLAPAGKVTNRAAAAT